MLKGEKIKTTNTQKFIIALAFLAIMGMVFSVVGYSTNASVTTGAPVTMSPTTAFPTHNPTTNPTTTPTGAPSESPTKSPTDKPTNNPTP